MAEARRLKSGRWRIYLRAHAMPVRDPASHAIVSFESLVQARRWWQALHPGDPPLGEAPRCARCGAYFGASMEPVSYAGRLFHGAHTPPAITDGRGFTASSPLG